MDQAKDLIERLLSHPESTKVDSLANELLTEYHRGSAVESLRSLLSSTNDRLVGKGAWIASELGELGKPLLSEIGNLLRHRSKKARFWSIDCVHLWAGPSDGSELATAVALVDDTEEAVRWKAMAFISMASRAQLQAAIDQLAAANPASAYDNELTWLLGSEGSDAAGIIGGIRAHDPRRRRFAAAAAFRIAKDNSEPLRYATAADDPEIAQFARDMLERIVSP